MKKTEYLCDRCRKIIPYELLAENQTDFPYILRRRFRLPVGSFIDHSVEGDYLDLCEDCQENFKKWLGEEDT